MFGPMLHLASACLFASVYPQIDILVFYLGTSWISIIGTVIRLAGLHSTLSTLTMAIGTFYITLIGSIVYGAIISTCFYNPKAKDHRDKLMGRGHVFCVATASALSYSLISPYTSTGDAIIWTWMNGFTWALELLSAWIVCAAATIISGSRNARHYYDNSRYSTILYHSLIISSIFPLAALLVNPSALIMSIFKDSAETAQHILTLLSWAVPLFLMNRYVEGYVVDYKAYNEKVQSQSKRRASPVHYYKAAN